jgi:hypothetical protein
VTSSDNFTVSPHYNISVVEGFWNTFGSHWKRGREGGDSADAEIHFSVEKNSNFQRKTSWNSWNGKGM